MSDETPGAFDAEHQKVLDFDRDSWDFVYGFEAGMVYAEAQAILHLDLATPHSRMIHAANAEMAIRIAESAGLSFWAEEADEDWVTLYLDVPE